MSTAHVIVTVLAATMVGFSAGCNFFRASWVVEPLTAYGVPRSWWSWLGATKAAGAVGLLAGLAVPLLGILAGIGLVLYFTGAVITVMRAGWHSHVTAPLVFVAPVVGSLVLGFAA